jgi:hypothetical protein
MVRRGFACVETEADLGVVICIEPETEDGQPYKPWRLRDSALAVATFAEEAQAGKTGYMDEAMVSGGFASSRQVLRGADDEDSTRHWWIALWRIKWMFWLR